MTRLYSGGVGGEEEDEGDDSEGASTACEAQRTRGRRGGKGAAAGLSTNPSSASTNHVVVELRLPQCTLTRAHLQPESFPRGALVLQRPQHPSAHKAADLVRPVCHQRRGAYHKAGAQRGDGSSGGGAGPIHTSSSRRKAGQCCCCCCCCCCGGGGLLLEEGRPHDARGLKGLAQALGEVRR